MFKRLFNLRTPLAAAIFGLIATTPVALMLGGCSSSTSSPSVSQVVSDVQTLAAGLAGATSGLAAAGVPANTIAQIQQYVTEAQQIATEIGSAPTGSVSSLVSGLPALIGGIASTVGVSLPPELQTALSAAQVLLPVIMAAAGVVGLAPAPGAPPMSPDKARAILRAMATA